VSGEAGEGDDIATTPNVEGRSHREPGPNESRVTVPPRVATEPPLAPAWAGRYTFVRKLAEGGMGEVYIAYDEELDRRVAMKLLRRAVPSAAEQQRMHREAQALARLSHPNVVQVYDVGHHGEQLFVTMELVVGADLRRWLRAAKRGWREVLEVMLQAGEGLAAAHQAGLIHRDIKPDNILVGDDGRVRMADFGLARSEVTLTDPVELPVRPSDEERSSWLDTPLTENGQILGTPAYMAAEQFLGAQPDVRSDVFSFCVVLYEGLFGQRPFPGRDWQEIAVATHAGHYTPPACDPPVPAWLTRTIARGLLPDPKLRHPSLAALLLELRRPLQAARRRWQWFGALGALAVGLAVGATTLQRSAPCVGADQAALALWTPERQAALHAAFVAVAPDAGAEISTRLSAHLEHYVGELKLRSMDACLAYQRGERSDSLYDRERACLDRRRGEVEALLTVLATPDAEVAAKALGAVEGLRDLASCGDRVALLAQVAPPEPATQAAMPPLLLRLDRIRALRLGGRYQEADAEVTPLVVEIRALGYAPLTAESLVERALLSLELARANSAEQDLLAAVNLAEGAGADELRLAAMTALLRVLGYTPETSIDVLATLEPQALALVERRGELRREAHALVLLAAGEGYIGREKPEPASGRLETAIGLLEPLGDGVASELAEAYNDLAMIRSIQTRYGDAHALYQQARRLLERVNGPHHPNLGFIANNEARAFDREGDSEAARSRFAEALALWEPVYGPEHPHTLIALNHLARISAKLGDTVAAAGYATRVLDGRERTVGPQHVSLVGPLQILARIELRSGDLGSARARSERALAILEHAHGVDSPKLFESLDLASQVAQARGETGVAITLQERCMAVASSDLLRARARFRLAGIRWERGDYSLARADAEAVLVRSELHNEVTAWLAAHPLPSKRHR